MKDGGTLTINDLPLGITYTVIETANTDFFAENGLERTGLDSRSDALIYCALNDSVKEEKDALIWPVACDREGLC